MRAYCKTYKTTFVLQLLFAGLYLANLFFPLNDALYGRGIAVINGEWRRLFFAPYLHYGVLHLIANLLGAYYAGTLLEPCVGSVRLAVFAVLAGVIATVGGAFAMPDSMDFAGGSILVFAMLGLLLVRRFLYKDRFRLRLGTWRGNYLLGYATLGNVPILPFMDGGSLVLHTVSFVTGVLLATIAFLCRKTLSNSVTPPDGTTPPDGVTPPDSTTPPDAA